MIIVGSKLEKLANRSRIRRWLTANDLKKTLRTCKEDFMMGESKLLVMSNFAINTDLDRHFNSIIDKTPIGLGDTCH